MGSPRIPALVCPRPFYTDVNDLFLQNLVSLLGTWRVECPYTSVNTGGSYDTLHAWAPRHPRSRPARGAARRRGAAASEGPSDRCALDGLTTCDRGLLRSIHPRAARSRLCGGTAHRCGVPLCGGEPR